MRKTTLITLFTSISITGFSFIDNLILNRIIAIIVAISFLIVGVLYKCGIIGTKREGSEAFKYVLIILIIFALIIYSGIRKFQDWFLASPMCVKIIIPSALGLLIIGIIGLIIYNHFSNDEYVD